LNIPSNHGITFCQKTWRFSLVKTGVALLHHFPSDGEYYIRLERGKKNAQTFPDRGKIQNN